MNNNVKRQQELSTKRSVQHHMRSNVQQLMRPPMKNSVQQLMWQSVKPRNQLIMVMANQNVLRNQSKVVPRCQSKLPNKVANKCQSKIVNRNKSQCQKPNAHRYGGFFNVSIIIFLFFFCFQTLFLGTKRKMWTSWKAESNSSSQRIMWTGLSWSTS